MFCLRTFRGLVRPATLAGSVTGADVAPDELRSIVADLDGSTPDSPLVDSLPNLQELNIAAVAGELRAEDLFSTPVACRKSLDELPGVAVALGVLTLVSALALFYTYQNRRYRRFQQNGDNA